MAANNVEKYHIPLRYRPPLFRDGELEVYFPKHLVEKRDEMVVTYNLILNRRLFGQSYSRLMPDCFDAMGRDSGVMIGPFVKSSAIIQELSFPGDVDILIIPYEKGQLCLSETLAIEVKVVRAKYVKQGKGPNEFGFSQAKSFLSHGFPFSAVAHLITSDSSSIDKWQKVIMAKVENSLTGRLTDIKELSIDLLPSDLISRSFGRLAANCREDSLGLLAAYISFDNLGCWSPLARAARRNENGSLRVLESIGEFYEKNFRRFLDTPKY